MGTNIPNIGSSAIGDPIGKAVVEIIADDKAYQEGLKKSEKALGLFDKKTQRIAGKMGKAFLAGGTAIEAALIGVVFHAAKAGDELEKMSLRTGVSVEDLSRLSFAAQRSGSDVTALETSLRFLSRGMDEASDGIGRAKDVFDDLGISIMDQDGVLRDQPSVINDVATAIANLESETEQVAAAMDIFGARSGPALLPLLKQGEEGIRALTDRADELGIVMSTKAASASAEFQDRMLELTSSFKMAAFELGQALLPEVQKAVELFTRGIAEFNQLDEGTKKIIAYGAAVTGLFGIITGTGLLVVSRLDALTKGFKILGPVIASTPFAIAALAAADLGISIWAVKRAVDAFKDPANFLIGQLEGLETASEGMAGAIELIEEAMNEADSKGIDPLQASLDDLGIDLDDLNEKFNTSAGVVDVFFEKAGAAAKILRGALEGTVGGFEDVVDGVREMSGEIETVIPGTANAADVLDKLKENLGDAAEEATNLKGELDGLETGEKKTTEATKTLSKELKALQESMIQERGETWFLRVFNETRNLARTAPVVDIDPSTRGGMMGYIQSVIDAAKAWNELGDSIDENSKKIGLAEFDAGVIARGAKAKEAEAEEALANEAAFRAELERLGRAADEKELDRLVRMNIQGEKDHQNAIDAAIELSDKELDEKKKTIAGIERLESAADKKKAREDEKLLDDAVRDQERAAKEALRAWERTADQIEDAFEGLFEGMIREGRPIWEEFWEDLKNIAIRKLSEIAAEETIGRLLDKLAGQREAGRTIGGTVSDVAIAKTTGSIFDKIFGSKTAAAVATETTLPGGGTISEKIFGGVAPGVPSATTLFGETGSIATGIPSAVLPAIPLALPLIGLFESNRQEKERFREQRKELRDRLAELQFADEFIEAEVQKLVERQNRENRDDIPLAPRPSNRSLTFGRIDRRSSRGPQTPIEPADFDEGAGSQERGGGRRRGADNFVRIDQLAINMPPNIGQMSQVELDRNTKRQVDSTVRAFEQKPAARRRMRR